MRGNNSCTLVWLCCWLVLQNLSQLVFALLLLLSHFLRLLGIPSLVLARVVAVERHDAHPPVDVAHGGREDPQDDEGDVHGRLGVDSIMRSPQESHLTMVKFGVEIHQEYRVSRCVKTAPYVYP